MVGMMEEQKLTIIEEEEKKSLRGLESAKIITKKNKKNKKKQKKQKA